MAKPVLPRLQIESLSLLVPFVLVGIREVSIAPAALGVESSSFLAAPSHITEHIIIYEALLVAK